MRSLEKAEQAAEQANGLTKALLTFSRKTATEMEPLELRALVEKTTRLLQHMLPANVRLVVDLPWESPLWVKADGTQLQQVVLNLAINARDAMPHGGTLTVSLSSIPAGLSERPHTAEQRTRYAGGSPIGQRYGRGDVTGSASTYLRALLYNEVS